MPNGDETHVCPGTGYPIASAPLERTNRALSFEAVVECPYRLMCEVGSKAVINDEIQGRLDGLYVHKLRYSSDGGGEKTVITLRKEI